LNPEISLSPRELLFIAALLEATEFLGVSDAFFGMDDAEMHQETMALKSSLEVKDYAEMDFDGSFTLKENVRDAVDICANCDTLIMADKCKGGQLPLRDLYYAKNGKIVKLNQGADDTILSLIPGIDGLLEQILEDVKWQTSGPSMLKDAIIPNDVLSDVKAKAGDLDQSTSIEVLIGSGCDELSAKAIISGLRGKSDYFAVVITAFGSGREGIYSLMLTSNESGIYRLAPIAGEEQDAVKFSMLAAGEVKIALADVMRSAFPPESEGFV